MNYLTHNFPGIGGVLKQRTDDFIVQEIPLYEPSGEGEHVYCEIEKTDMSTFDAIYTMAGVLHVPSRAVGYAGMKDAKAVTRQVLSIQGVTEEAVQALKLPGINIQWVKRHGNKLRLGHLKGNRFTIKIREVDPTDIVKIKPALDMILQRGLPNYFGEQRFGRRNNNDQLGAALVRGDNETLLQLLLGSPDSSIDDPQTTAARKAFAARNNVESMKHWPRRSGMERRVLARLIKSHRPSSAIHAIDEKLRRLWVSALQSRLFNEVVAKRIETLDKVMDGDLAYKHENGACFHVENAATEQPRFDAFEISPTGPLLGYRMTMPAGEPLRIEQEVFAAAGLTPGEFRQPGREKVKGSRRPLRIKPEEVDLISGADMHGQYIQLTFALPAGSFATVLLGELMKPAETLSEPPACDAAEEAETDTPEQISEEAEEPPTE